MPLQQLPARCGVAVAVSRGQTLRIVNTHGHQVVDTWAFVAPSNLSDKPSQQDRSAFPVEYMSMCHNRAALNALRPTVGSTLVSNRRRPVMTLTTDTSPGVHDTLIAACDIYRYQGLIPDLESSGGYHDNCSDNLHAALQRLPEGKQIEDKLGGWTPDPLNLFMNIPWDDGEHGGITWEAPVSQPGDLVELRAERDLVVVMSACPQDVIIINGGQPVDVHYEVI